jgi:ABC-type sugar transport system permease subunit
MQVAIRQVTQNEGTRADRVPLRQRALRRRVRRDALSSLAFLAPALLVVGFFILYPLVRMVYLSMTEYDGLSAPKFVGAANYRYLLEWPDFRRIVANTFVLLLGIPVWVVGPLVISIILFGRRRAGVFRVLFLVPALLPALVIGVIFRLVLSDQGPVNGALRALNLGFLAKGWVSSDPWVLITIVTVIAWGLFGMGVLFYSAALSTIPGEIIEAAVLDGASWSKIVWYVLRPELVPATKFWMSFLALSTVTAFFTWIFTLTRGGPGVASTTLDFAVYQLALVRTDLGRAAAVSVVGIAMLALVLAIAQIIRKAREA